MDEAQYLSTGILEDIKMLMNYGYDSVNCFTLVLCGEPHLNSTLRKPVHEALRQRITVRRFRQHHRTGSPVCRTLPFPGHDLSSPGIPRLVDNLMTDALALGAQMDKKTIDTEVILAAVSSQNLS